jgi:glucosamine-phosphate N-acetyltransferase
VITVRLAQNGDCLKGLVETLRTLSPVYGDPFYIEGTVRIRAESGSHATYVAVDCESGSVVGTASVLMEWKLTYDGEPVAHIEDVAVRPEWQGQGIGSLLVEVCKNHARSKGCRKIVLDCDESRVGFYEKEGFYRAGVCMRLDLPGAHECS